MSRRDDARLARFDALDSRITAVSDRLSGRIDALSDRMDSRFDAVTLRIDTLVGTSPDLRIDLNTHRHDD